MQRAMMRGLRNLVTIVAGSLLVAACGRIDFNYVAVADGAPDGVPDIGTIGHDEDGDGIGDVVDLCPHVVGDGADGDGDGVGDACDPDPTLENRIRVFSSLRTGDHPFSSVMDLVQEDDGLRYTGLSLHLVVPQPMANARFELGFEVVGLVGTDQHQIASGIEAGTQPYYFVELNENLGSRNVSVISYDNTNGYVSLDTVLHGGIHPGVGILRSDVATTPPRFSVVTGWTGELYSATAAVPGFVGGSDIRVVVNGLDVVLRYVVIIDR